MMKATIFAALAAALPETPSTAIPHPRHPLTPALTASGTKAGVRSATPPAAERSSDVFSLRARRRFAAYLRMRLLEMREAGLERAADAVERQLPIEELLSPPR